jgi:hypothetical protein
MFSSITIGDGGDYDTIALWQVARRNSIPADKQVDDELTLLSGTYEAFGLLWQWPVDEEVSIKVVIQAHPSALHNGDWDSGVCLSGQGTQVWKVRNNDLNITYRDIVLKKAQVQFEQGDNYFGSIRGTGWDMSAIHHGSLTFERCLIYTEGLAHTRMHYMSYVPSSSPSAFGTLEVNYNNCVLEDIYGPVYPSYGQIIPAYYPTSGDHTFNFRGCTLSRQSFFITDRLTSYAGNENPNGSLTINVSGCIEDTSAAAQPTLVAGHAINLGYYPGGIGFPSNLSATLTDHITNEASGSVYDWATTKTNVSYGVPFTFDGTVTNGEVGFVDNQGASSFRDYRLVADFDNLAVQYATNADLGKKDTAGTVRPALTDVGAYQSISTNTYTDKIGASADYDTLSLWHGASATNILNGDSFNLQFLSGAHDIAGLYSNFNEVDFDIILQAHPSALHNGDWNAGASIVPSSFNCFMYFFGDQTVSITIEDLVFNYSVGSRSFLIGNTNSTSGSCAQFSSTLTLNRCMLRHPSGIVNAAEFIWYYIGFEDVDASGNVSALGKNTFNINNCVILGAREYKFLTNTNQNQAANFEFNVKGTTIDVQDRAIAGFLRPGGNTKDYADSYFTANFEGTILPQRPVHYNSFRDGWGSATRAFTFTDYITYRSQSEMEGYLDGGSTNPPTFTYSNASFSVPVNYDGTVTSGEVCYVGPSGHEGNYRLVADLDNLAVKYATNSTLPTLDVSRYNRPGLTDAGAYQSISTDNVINVIGSGVDGVSADFATVSLWYGDRRTEVLNGATEIGALQSQTHTYNGSYNQWDEVNFTACLSGQTHHNGNWDEGAKLLNTAGYVRYGFGNQSIEYKFEDLVYEVEQTSYGSVWDHYAITNRDGSGYNSDVTFRRCLVTSTDRNSENTFFRMLVNLSAVESIGTQNTTIENCVFDVGTRAAFGNEARGSNGNDYNVYNRVVGSTIFSTQNSTWIGQRGVINGVTNSDVIGCLNYNANPGRYMIGYGSVVYVDYITNENNLWYSTSALNSSAAQTFTFDNTVTEGAVCLVGSGYKGDFRLVADPDNLPVKYMTQDSLTYKDITGYKRPGGTDQRDAGAYQSISDRNTVHKIGTSSVDFPADYATLNLWWSTNYLYANVLNGETHTLQFKSGEVHNTAASIYFDGIVGNVSANVNQSFVFSGQTPHNGNWDEGATLLGGNALVRCGKNSFNFTVKDLSLVVSGNAQRLFYVSPTHNTNYATPGYFAPEHTYTFENFMARMDDGLSSTAYQIMMDQNYERITDEDLNVIERGSSKSIHKNCLYIGAASSNGVGNRGSLCVYAHQYGTAASAFFQTEGCTFINSWFSDGRHSMAYDNLKVDHAGLIYYASESHKNQFGFQLGLHSPGNFGDYNTQKPENATFKDCIFNNGSNNSITPNASQGRYDIWVIEPIASELDIYSSTILREEPWLEWEPRLTNCSFRVPFNFDGSVSAGTVSFESSATKDYRLVPDLDNLAVQYMNVSNTSNYDLAGRRRPGLTDAGAFQSYSDSVVSALIGSGVDGVSADHATVALFYAASGDKIINGQTFDLAFQNQEHDFIVNIGINPLLEVDQKWIVRGDTIQDGEWDTGARFIENQFLTNQLWWGTVGSKLKKQDVIFELKDLVFSSNTYHQNWAHFNASREIRDAAHDCTYTFDRCLISTPRHLGWPYPNLLANNEQTGELGLNTINILNTVVSGGSNSNNLIIPYRAGHEGPNVAHNFVGSTFYHRRSGYRSIDGSSDYRISGCLFHMDGNDTQRLLNAPASRYNVTAVDNIFSNSQSYEEYSLGTDHTNCTFDVNFNYDGSVKSGQVSFVSSTNDFRLVPDLDNLAVKYMTSGELPYKDITGYKRPGGIDQRDAGAYQSISDKNTVYKIGTSSVDFPADYATLFLWSWNDHFYANILNGETHTLQFKSGEIHDPAASINFNGTVGSVSANVNQSFVYSGQTPHNGNWDEGAILAINGSTNGAAVRCGKNSFNFTVKDLSLVVSGNALNRRLFYVSPTHSNYTTPGYFAPEQTYTFENFMARMDDGLSSIGWELMMDQNYERITDEDLNILERGSSKSIHKNCLYVGAASSDGVGYNGSLNVYSHQYNTQASAFFQTEGCTFINSWFSNGRHSMKLNQLKVDHAGLLYYAGVGRGLSLHGPFGFAAARYPDDTLAAANNSKFVDCIFSNGAGDSIAPPASQDRYSTWVIEPLPSEYRDSSSGIVEFYQPWNVWASALTNCSFRVPFNFDGSVSAGTVSFVDGSSGVNNYRLVGSEDNFASGYVSSFNLSGLDLAGNDRGDSPYDAGAFAITLQQVEDFLKSLGGPLVLQVGYRISNNRQRLIPVIGGEE